jgi:hypothetical protein
MPLPTNTALLRFAVYYALGMFALGFVLGTVRTLALLPLMGALAAVCIEVPVMLAASWWYSRWLLAKQSYPYHTVTLLRWGMVAFALLVGMEMALATIGFRQPVMAFFTSLLTPAGAVGLTAQLLFGLIPAMQAMRR